LLLEFESFGELSRHSCAGLGLPACPPLFEKASSRILPPKIKTLAHLGSKVRMMPISGLNRYNRGFSKKRAKSNSYFGPKIEFLNFTQTTIHSKKLADFGKK
jgi:hypothetical protein